MGEVDLSATVVATLAIRDPDCPAAELVRLYHDRWEIETGFLELKRTILGGRVLRARPPRPESSK